MNINDLTIGQAKEISALLGSVAKSESTIGNQFIGKPVIIRTYSAGVWFGVLSEKSGSEVIVKDARRMWRWQAKESISLSAVAKFGIDQSKSKIAPAVEFIWLEAIEIIPATPEATALIEGATDVKAE